MSLSGLANVLWLRRRRQKGRLGKEDTGTHSTRLEPLFWETKIVFWETVENRQFVGTPGSLPDRHSDSVSFR